MITIILNGKVKTVDSDNNIEQLLKSLDLENKRLAVEINQQIIPRSEFNSHILKERDKVEIVQAIGGGKCWFFMPWYWSDASSRTLKSSTIHQLLNP